MDLRALAAEADTIMTSFPYEVEADNGVEVAPGWFNVYNEVTSQSKKALLHEESGYVFKRSYSSERWTASGSYIADVNFDGIDYRVRLPEFHLFDGIAAQEYIGGEHHYCGGSASCEHTLKLSDATGYFDCHAGNWKIFNGEIVLFDFD